MFSFIPDYDEDERLLAQLEQSWADHHRGLRTGFRVRVQGDGAKSMRAGSLAQVAAEMSRLKAEFDNGDKSAVMRALEYSAIENVPIPYWAGDGLGEILKTVRNAETDLHRAFDFHNTYPTSPKRSKSYRQDRETMFKLYVAVGDRIDAGMNKTAAIRDAVKSLPIQFRKAFRLYNEMDERQKAASAAWTGRKLHQLR